MSDAVDANHESHEPQWDDMHPEIFQRTTFGYFKWLLWDFVAALLDVVLPSPEVKHSPSDIEGLTDEDIISTANRMKDRGLNSESPCVWRIAHNSVLKVSYDQDLESEVMSLALIAQQTKIPVPRVRRVLNTGFVPGPTDDGFVMEYVPGVNLAAVWPRLGWFSRLKVAYTIRSYIRQLRRVRVPRGSVPGPLRQPGEPAVESDMPFWGDIRPRRGPFDSSASLLDFLNRRNESAIQMRDQSNSHMKPSSYYPVPPEATFNDAFPLVLCHMDLAPHNFLLGDDGTLWLIDFGFAGMWPPWFEYIAMRQNCGFAWKDEKDPAPRLHWRALVPVMSGRFQDQEILFERMAAALSYR